MSARLSVIDMPMLREDEEAGARLAAQAGATDVEAAALAGDADAWATLIERHGRRVLVALLGRGVPLERAKEIAQETWLRLMERQREGRLCELTLPGLAIVQAGYLAANERRRDGHAASALSAAALPAPTGGPNAEEAVVSRQRLGRVAAALAACPPGARRVFELCYDNPDLGYAEIARRVGLSVQRVKQTVFEVRQRLRAALDEEGTP